MDILVDKYNEYKNVRDFLNYEKSLKLEPYDEDVENNLKLANLKTEDKIDALPNLFFVDWMNSITNLMTERGWSIVCIISLFF